jgi:uncharacterized protein (DUF2249 family)
MKIHPGVKVAIDKLGMDELDIAKAIAAGQLTSPQTYMNITLFAIRITGTGAAYRQSLDEYVWRDPKLYLNQHFIERCSGLAVIMSHPPKNALDTKEFRERNIGSIMFAYVHNGDEVWAIAKIQDHIGAEIMAKYNLSTSPAVVFKPADGNRKLDLDDGSTLLIEGKPSLLDHIAICEEGVWDKGGLPAGVTSTENEERTDSMPEGDAGQKLDKLLTAMDNLGARMDAVEGKVTKRDDTEGCPPEMMQKLDDDAAKRDDGDEGEPEELKGMPEETASDKARKDAARAHWKARKDTYKGRRDAAKKDGELPEDLKKEIDTSAAKDDEMPPELAARAGDRKDAAGAHWKSRKDFHMKAKADTEGKEKELPEDLKNALDDDAKKRGDADDGEPKELKEMEDGVRKDSARAFHRSRVASYRQVRLDAVKPLAQRLDDLSARIPKVLADADRTAFADVQARADTVYHALGSVAPRPMDGEDILAYRRRLAKGVQKHSTTWKDISVGTLGADAFTVAEAQVYADAMTAAQNPTDLAEDELREITKTDMTGRRITSFVGKPGAWMSNFGASRRLVTGFSNKSN